MVYTLALVVMVVGAASVEPQSSNQAPQILEASAAPAVPRVGQSAIFTVTAADPDSDGLTYSWDFGDGSPPTPFGSASGATHAYANPGHYLVLVWVSDGWIQVSKSFFVGVSYPPTSPQPRSSGTILYDGARNRAWTVNPDSDTATAIDGMTLSKAWESPVGKEPRTLAQAPDGAIWVVNQEDATISILDPDNGGPIQTIPLAYGSRPFGIVFSPDGKAAYVTLQATGRLTKLDPAARTVLGTLDVCPTPRGIAVTGDSGRILVTRFISAADHAEVAEVSAAGFTVTRTFVLAMDPGPDSSFGSRGVPNYLSSVTITPDGRRAWIPSKKDNTGRGLNRDGLPLTFETTLRTIVAQIDLSANQEDLAGRIDIDDSNMAAAVAFSPEGDMAFVALQGMNSLLFRDRYDAGTAFGSIPYVEGLAPQGLVFDATGARLFIQNFMSRNVSVYDTSRLVGLKDFSPPRLATVPTVSQEKLSPQVLRGKQIFYNANVGVRDHDRTNKVNRDAYTTCASCHLEGDSDGRVWDLTQLGEGFRNTISLLGRRGTGMGRVHWTANFDEIQDFEHPIRDLFEGTGFLTPEQFDTGTRSQPLGDPKAGLDPDLDALAAYVSSLDKVHASPFRTSDGALTAEGQAGKLIFRRLRCASCHSGADFTDRISGLLHDVGTGKPTSGNRLGGPLPGFGTPTLKGIWETAPYLHDGSAATLVEVLTTANVSGRHADVSSLTPGEMQQLVAYLQQIDETEAADPGSLLFVAILTGAEEVPPTSSPSRGFGKVVLDADGLTALVSLDLSGLQNAPTEVHIHGPAAPGTSGPIVFTLPPGSFMDFTLVLTPEQAQQLKDGLLYFNVHTASFPGGELRGRIQVPSQKGSSPPSPDGSGGGCGALGLEALLFASLTFLRRGRLDRIPPTDRGERKVTG